MEPPSSAALPQAHDDCHCGFLFLRKRHGLGQVSLPVPNGTEQVEAPVHAAVALRSDELLSLPPCRWRWGRPIPQMECAR